MLIELGNHIQHKNRTWRVVRIIHNSETLFEPVLAEAYILSESYAELKAIDGDIDHISISFNKIPYSGIKSNIRALEPIPGLEKEIRNASSIPSGS